MSHTLWHIAIIGLSILLLLPPRMPPAKDQIVSWPLVVISAFLYGFTYFAVINEGGTVPLGLPAAILIVFVLAVGARTSIRSNNLTAFFFLGYLIAVTLFGLWYAYWGGFPEFSETGLI
jgi:hypothetical protein